MFTLINDKFCQECCLIHRGQRGRSATFIPNVPARGAPTGKWPLAREVTRPILPLAGPQRGQTIQNSLEVEAFLKAEREVRLMPVFP